MKKNEYMIPEVEIVEITEQVSILGVSDDNGNLDDGGNTGGKGGKWSRSTNFGDEE